ncbi:GNAT family N-acetyltransferase [Streptomyces monticola]|uniref:GNAT family N-acetyltransferase n=1 Tax=Streptomyces monticola TaxID=2666263 RepID=A0ABW2JJP2_9ACTN
MSPADVAAVRALFDRQMRQEARPSGPGVRIERADGVVRQVGIAGDWTGILWSDLDDATADAVIAEQIRYFTGPESGPGSSFEWKAYAHDTPADLPERLLKAGFTPEPTETLMVADVRNLPTTVELPAGVRLETVTDPAGVDLIADVHEQAFGTSSDRLRRQLLAQLAEAPQTVDMTVALADGRPVCSARLEFCPGTDFAGLWGGGTVTAWRGKGIYRALIAHRTRIAAARGHRYLQVDASDQSRPILQRLGFTPLSTTTPYLYG